MSRIASRVLRILVAAIFLWLPATAHSQQPSVADAARQARAQKKQTKSPPRQWTNDNLSGNVVTSGVSAGGGEWSTVPEAGSGGAGGAAAAGGASELTEEQKKERADAESAVADAAKVVAERKKDLELLTRDFNLLRQQVFSNPNPASNPKGQADLNDLNSRIQAKRNEVQEAENKLAEAKKKLEDVNQKLGPKQEPAPTDPSQQSAWANRIRPLRAEIASIDAEIRDLGGPGIAASAGSGGGVRQDRVKQLQDRRAQLQKQIADIEEGARRKGVPPDWLR